MYSSTVNDPTEVSNVTYVGSLMVISVGLNSQNMEDMAS